MLGKVFGRQGLDAALEQRLQPYGYEPTRKNVGWVALAMAVFLFAAIFALVSDYRFRTQVNEWRDEGLSVIPIDNEEVSNASIVIFALDSPDDTAEGICAAEGRAVEATPTPNPANPSAEPGDAPGTSVLFRACRSMERMFEHAAVAGIDCTNAEDFATVVRDDVARHPDCERLITLSERYDSLQTATGISTVLIVFSLILVAFPFSTFTHKSSRNLRTLKSEGQQHSPEGTVIRLFIPFVNIYKPVLMFMELFKASDPRVPGADSSAWKRAGTVSPVAILWGLAWGAVLVFNPITVPRIFLRSRENLDDVSSVTGGLLIADVLLIAATVLAVVTAYLLMRRQELRAAAYGTVTVTPARPRDPIQEALEEERRSRTRHSEDDENNTKEKK